MKFIDTIHSNDTSYIKKEREKIEFEHYYTKKHLNIRSNYIKIDKNVRIDENNNHYDDDFDDDQNNYDDEMFDDDDNNNNSNDNKSMSLMDRRKVLEIKRLEKLHHEKVSLSLCHYVIINIIITIID
jgi:hypothetical protein